METGDRKPVEELTFREAMGELEGEVDDATRDATLS